MPAPLLLTTARARVKVVGVDFPRAVCMDVHELGASGNIDCWCAVGIDLKLLVVHSFDVDISGAANLESLQIRDRNPELHRFDGRVAATVPQSQHIVTDFRSHQRQNVVVAFDFQTQVLLTDDFDSESAFSRD